ncbi:MULTISPECIES: hypothetical protein [unclassified Streptomyces]|uniref:hypothetical protein n=1 Tax=unclassified Streptomyces TaxID=2593676 RepID=UPI002DDAC8CC|nr:MULTISPECIES: hypothetical protein [unclassified Streptomyces]WSA92981.1 hypothetical protein OIE63_16415 [Streptomyces sp. NBC_01795]WSB77350.1 hypothetical protein OHB04_17250 [Streptomyces sp. NBC_01775]WSS43202.1 hypothetical protein OG220_23400 [Streptomyces sp. NBC_01187]
MGGGKEGDVRWNKESLDLIEKGLKGAIDELKESGGSSTSSLQGAGFEELALSGMEAGHSGLAGDFEDFCEKWEWGVRALVQNANALAKKLGLSAGMSYEEDQYAAGTVKVALNSALLSGNPHASEEEIAKQSYGDIVMPDAPDWSKESWDKAGDDISQDWKDTGRELTSKGRGGMYMDWAQEASGMSDEQIEAGRDRAFGPSPEERAQQQGSGGEGGEG